MTDTGMLPRRWVIAACFCEPGDYGIPTAPTFAGCRDEEGVATVLYSDEGEEVMRAETLMKCRR